MRRVEDFLSELPRLGVAPEYVAAYRRTLQTVAGTLAAGGKVDLEPTDLPDLLEAARHAGATPRQVRNLETACITYLRWLKNQGDAGPPAGTRPQTTLRMGGQLARELPTAIESSPAEGARSPEGKPRSVTMPFGSQSNGAVLAVAAVHDVAPLTEAELSPWIGVRPTPTPTPTETEPRTHENPSPPSPFEPPAEPRPPDLDVPVAPAPSPPSPAISRAPRVAASAAPSVAPHAPPFHRTPVARGRVARVAAASPRRSPVGAIVGLAAGLVLTVGLVALRPENPASTTPAPGLDAPAESARSGSYQNACQRLAWCCREKDASTFCGIAQTNNLSQCAGALNSTFDSEGIDCRMEERK